MENIKLLLVDDDVTLLSELSDQMTRMGFTILATATNGLDGYIVAKIHKPDLVIMDLIMPGSEMNGIEAAEKIMNELDIPVIFLSGYSDSNIIEKIKDTLPYGFLTKPFQDFEISIQIQIALYKKRLEKKVSECIEKISFLTDHTSDALITTNKEGSITNWNNSAERFFSYRRNEAIGMPVNNIFGCEFTENYISKIYKSIVLNDNATDKTVINIIANNKAGRKFPVEIDLMAKKLSHETEFLYLVRFDRI